MITQQSNENRCARAFFFDGHENVLATSDIGLSPFDLDELNVCHTLDNPLVPGGPPEAGLVVFAFTDPRRPPVPPFPFGPAAGRLRLGQERDRKVPDRQSRAVPGPRRCGREVRVPRRSPFHFRDGAALGQVGGKTEHRAAAWSSRPANRMRSAPARNPSARLTELFATAQGDPRLAGRRPARRAACRACRSAARRRRARPSAMQPPLPPSAATPASASAQAVARSRPP